MSSAALQAAPHQPTALATPPLIANSPSGRQYPSTHSSPTREAYNASQSVAGNSPSSSSRRPSRQRSGNGASVTATSTNYSQAGPNSPMTSRAAISSPVPVASPDQLSTTSSDRRRHHHMPQSVPPRTSSNHHSSTADRPRRTGHSNDKGAASPRRGRDDATRGEVNGIIDAAMDDSHGATTSSRSRRAQIAQDPPQRSSSNRDGRTGGTTTVVPIRTHAPPQPASSTSSKQPSREASEVLNRIIVSQPEVDVERERERMEEAQPHRAAAVHNGDDAAPPPVVGTGDHGDETRRGGRRGHEHSTRRDKIVKFGDYILGNTIGEGEFGKVKLGWKQDGGTQVAIKLIKRDSVGNNPTRLAKIYREISILRGISHPNIVRLHEMVETERHIGIILEYASGGELFDHILHHRYLKDSSARRLFAQLISGVGYLHKKGIVHRDLKLENLLLDRNKNIIITDFGFANTFDASEELTEEEENNLSDRDFVKRIGLDKIKADGTRRGDLMQTSCGSPCYAAPELVVSDSLYTGRKVDVWSCGVILYAMLAGYLPFDDDPANPEGDNINLLYKYIVNTPLTFPEYVTPHARDLLRRILVPNPRRRADLFEVARHSWLSEYAHVVEFITSSTTDPTEIQNTTVPAEDQEGAAAGINRSASVREPTKSKAAQAAAIGGLSTKHGTVDQEAEAAHARAARDAKRRTVQVEYVAPRTQTQRGEPVTTPASKRTRVRSSSQGPIEVTDGTSPKDKPLPRDPPVDKDAYRTGSSHRRPPSTHKQNAPPTRPSREGRIAADNAYMTTVAGAAASRPQTGGSMGSRPYAQPSAPAVAGTNVHGRIEQPTGPASLPQVGSPDSQTIGRPSISVPAKFAKVTGFAPESETQPPTETKGHRRSNTIGDISSKLLGRSGSLFGGRKRQKTEQQAEKPKKYPPVSMSANLPAEGGPRQSMDSRESRRSISLGFGKKRSGSVAGSQTSQEKQTRRFSLIPASFSLKAIGIGKEYGSPDRQSQQELPIQDPPRTGDRSRFVSQPTDPRGSNPFFEGTYQEDRGDYQSAQDRGSPIQHQRYASEQYKPRSAVPSYMQGAHLNTGSDSSVDQLHQQQQQHHRRQASAPYQPQFAESDGFDGRRIGASRGNRGVLQKNKKNFNDVYDQDEYRDHSGSSGAAKRVMDFFRRRGKARAADER